jgi:hypothetical protein
MMHEIFNTAKRPFFASCSNLHLDFIDTALYADFINRMFKKYSIKITDEALDFILVFSDCHTFYTQYFCNYLFAANIKNIDLKEAQNVAVEVLKLNEPTYFQYRNLITSAQWNLLQAIAKENKLFQAHSKAFISKYGLGTSSMISRGLNSLLDKELIYYNSAVEHPYYQVYDKFMMRWMQHSL